MSLINDALKRAEKSLNNNNSDQHKERIPSFDFEPSGKNKKLFYITLFGGTLFFSVLIALIMLLRSIPEPTQKTPQPNTLATPSFAAEISADKEDLEKIEASQERNEYPSESEINEATSAGIDEAQKVASSDRLESPAAENPAANEAKKNLNEEFIEGMVGLASRAFTGSTSSNKNSGNPQEAQKESPKQDYSLSTAQEMLEMLEKQAKNNIEVPTPENPIQDFINNLSITGVMIADQGSQVLINNQVYKNHSVISQSLHLILAEIKPHEITIRDSSGKTYIKDF